MLVTSCSQDGCCSHRLYIYIQGKKGEGTAPAILLFFFLSGKQSFPKLHRADFPLDHFFFQKHITWPSSVARVVGNLERKSFQTGGNKS